MAAERIAVAQILEQQKLDQQASAQNIENNARAAQQAISQATVTAGEVGAFGASFESLVSEFAQQEADFEAQVYGNLATKNQLAELNLQNAALATEGRIYNSWTQDPTPVNYIGHALAGINTGFQLYNSMPADWKSRSSNTVKNR